MTWLTWRQLRVSSSFVIAVLAALAIALALTAHGLHSSYAVDAATFLGQLQFNRLDRFLYLAGLIAVLAAPPVIAAFWGAPMIALELEAGTHGLVWTQSTTRNCWLSTKFAVTGVIAAVAVGAVGLVVAWWARPIDRAVAAGHGIGPFNLARMAPVVFGARGIVGIGYVLFGLAVGATVGLLLRRSVPAIAVTLAVVAAAEILVPLFVRAHLATPVSSTVVITTDNLEGIQMRGEPGQPPRGPVFVRVHAGGPGDWRVTNETVSSTGSAVALPAWFGDCVRPRPPAPPPADGATKVRAGRRDEFDPCFARLASEGYRQHVVYQPARNFWALQVRETGLLLVLAGLLTGFCFWRINRDVS